MALQTLEDGGWRTASRRDNAYRARARQFTSA